MSASNSYYLYQKYEKRGDQPWIPVFPSTYSVDGDGTMPIVVKTTADPRCNSRITYGASSKLNVDFTKFTPNAYAETFGTIYIGGKLTSINDRAFFGKTNLRSIIIPDGTITIGYNAFSGCTSLTAVSIPNSVTSINNSAFSKCSGLTSVNIPDSVTNIGNSAFESCKGLTSVTIGTSITNIGNWAFQYCSNLTSITVNATTPPAVGGSTFNSTNNSPIYVPPDSVDVYKSAWSTYASRIQATPT